MSRLAILLALIAIATPAAASDMPDPLVKAQTDIVAAKLCRARGFPLMARLGAQYVICIASRAGVSKDLRVLEVDAVLRAKP